jgi:hypothetical protein
MVTRSGKILIEVPGWERPFFLSSIDARKAQIVINGLRQIQARVDQESMTGEVLNHFDRSLVEPESTEPFDV